MQKKDVDREARLRELALKLFFTLEKQGSQFALYRDVDVSKPVRNHHLTLDEVEDILKGTSNNSTPGGETSNQIQGTHEI
jgi:hypothetical protein